tara:strand:- start:1778 stop:2440 length:663 start_codon:yes stop_codon:yes gene_type:complete
MILVDMDVVEDHNLNRQQLYSKRHIGVKKVMAAVEVLEGHHNLVTAIEAHHLDALANWNIIVALARECTVMFQTIDHGDSFDYACGALCRKLSIPMVLGGTEPFFGHLASTFFQPSEDTEPCYACVHDMLPPLDVAKIETYEDVSFLPPDTHPPIGGSTTYSASACSQLMLSQWTTYLMRDLYEEEYIIKHTLILRLIPMELEAWRCERNPSCTSCGETT